MRKLVLTQNTINAINNMFCALRNLNEAYKINEAVKYDAAPKKIIDDTSKTHENTVKSVNYVNSLIMRDAIDQLISLAAENLENFAISYLEDCTICGYTLYRTNERFVLIPDNESRIDLSAIDETSKVIRICPRGDWQSMIPIIIHNFALNWVSNLDKNNSEREKAHLRNIVYSLAKNQRAKELTLGSEWINADGNPRFGTDALKNQFKSLMFAMFDKNFASRIYLDTDALRAFSFLMLQNRTEISNTYSNITPMQGIVAERILLHIVARIAVSKGIISSSNH